MLFAWHTCGCAGKVGQPLFYGMILDKLFLMFSIVRQPPRYDRTGFCFSIHRRRFVRSFVDRVSEEHRVTGRCRF